MKIIDAVWELENLRVSCTEIVVDATTETHALLAALDRQTAGYVCVKVPCEAAGLIELIQHRGFVFREALLGIRKKLNGFQVPEAIERRLKTTTCEPMNQEDLNQLWEQIDEGMFDTDRIYRDSRFGPLIAARRYRNWIKTELSKSAEIHKIAYGGQNIGFFVTKQIAYGVFYPFLAGMYKTKYAMALGPCAVVWPILHAKNRGGRYINTWISSNNMRAVRLHVELDFSFEEMLYVFTRMVPPDSGQGV